MKQLWFFYFCLLALITCMSSYSKELANKDRHTKERMIRFLHNQELRFESFIQRCDNQDRLTPATKQKLVDIQTMITNLKNATRNELQKQEDSKPFDDDEYTEPEDSIEFEQVQKSEVEQPELAIQPEQSLSVEEQISKEPIGSFDINEEEEYEEI